MQLTILFWSNNFVVFTEQSDHLQPKLSNNIQKNYILKLSWSAMILYEHNTQLNNPRNQTEPKKGMRWVPEVKRRKATMAAWLWASLRELKVPEEVNVTPLTWTEAVKLGMWSGPFFMAEYSGKPHFLLWHSSCNFVLYIFTIHLHTLQNNALTKQHIPEKKN